MEKLAKGPQAATASLLVLLDDDEYRIHVMRGQIKERFPSLEHKWFDNAPDMTEWLKSNLVSVRLMSLDHDLGPNRKRDGQTFDPGEGRDVVDLLTSQKPGCSIIVHTSNSLCGDGMQLALETAGWTVHRIVPFSDQKWIETAWIEQVAECMGAKRS